MANNLLRLHRFIIEHYDNEELRTLCFDLGIRHDNLSGEGIGAKARELILQMGRRGQFDRLLTALRQNHLELFEQTGLEATPDAIRALYEAFPSLETKEAKSGSRQGVMLTVIGSAIIIILIIVGLMAYIPELRTSFPAFSTSPKSPTGITITFELSAESDFPAELYVSTPTGKAVVQLTMEPGTKQSIVLPPGDYTWIVQGPLPTNQPRETCLTSVSEVFYKGRLEAEFGTDVQVKIPAVRIYAAPIPGCTPSPRW